MLHSVSRGFRFTSAAGSGAAPAGEKKNGYQLLVDAVAQLVQQHPVKAATYTIGAITAATTELVLLQRGQRELREGQRELREGMEKGQRELREGTEKGQRELREDLSSLANVVILAFAGKTDEAQKLAGKMEDKQEGKKKK